MDTIKACKRDFTQKAKHLRKAGIIPGSVYGGSLQEDIPLQLITADVQKLLMTKMAGSRVTLVLDDKKIPVQIKDIERDALGNKLLCIDFQALKADQKINSIIHILLENTDKVIGVVEHMMTEIDYLALPADMIDTITIDLGGLPVGTTITVGDISELQNDKLELQVDKEQVILKIDEKKAVIEDEDEAEDTATAVEAE